MHRIWRWLGPVILALGAVVPVAAQTVQSAPVWPGVTLPTFVIPASAVNGGGVFNGQLLGPVTPTDCTAPQYSFQGHTTTGMGYAAAPADSLVLCAGGVTYGFRATGGIFIPAGVQIAWNDDLVFQREAANSFFQRNSTNAQRASWANTYASTTSYEAFSIDWQTLANNVFVGMRTAATGTNRTMHLVSQFSNAGNLASLAVTRDAFPLTRSGIITTTGTWDQNSSLTGHVHQFGSFTSVASSATTNVVAITPTYNQTGTASDTDLLIQRTETAIGSGAQYAIQTQRGSTNQFTVTAGSSGKGLQIATAQASVPTITTNGGTSPSCVGADTFMTCTEGTSPPAAATFTVTFNGTWAAAPSCIAVRGTTGASPLVQNVVTTTTTVQVNLSANLVASEKFHIHCGGVQ